jgi:hypothetical protein
MVRGRESAAGAVAGVGLGRVVGEVVRAVAGVGFGRVVGEAPSAVVHVQT